MSESVPVIFRNIMAEKPSMNIINCKCQLGSFKGRIHVLGSFMNSEQPKGGDSPLSTEECGS